MATLPLINNNAEITVRRKNNWQYSGFKKVLSLGDLLKKKLIINKVFDHNPLLYVYLKTLFIVRLNHKLLNIYRITNLIVLSQLLQMSQLIFQISEIRRLRSSEIPIPKLVRDQFVTEEIYYCPMYLYVAAALYCSFKLTWCSFVYFDLYVDLYLYLIKLEQGRRDIKKINLP